MVLATENPIEYEGTYPLPEAQLDRFLLRLRLGYLSADVESAMVRRRLDRGRDDVELRAVTDAAELMDMRRSLELIEVSSDLVDYAVAVVEATRNHPQIQVGASPRGSLALVQLARGRALLQRRDFVVPDDLKSVAVPALAHRVVLKPELWVRQVRSDDLISDVLANVPTPVLDPSASAPRVDAGDRRPRAD